MELWKQKKFQASGGDSGILGFPLDAYLEMSGTSYCEKTPGGDPGDAVYYFVNGNNLKWAGYNITLKLQYDLQV